MIADFMLPYFDFGYSLIRAFFTLVNRNVQVFLSDMIPQPPDRVVGFATLITKYF